MCENSRHLEELALEFRKGKPLDTEEILDKAVGSAQEQGRQASSL